MICKPFIQEPKFANDIEYIVNVINTCTVISLMQHSLQSECVCLRNHIIMLIIFRILQLPSTHVDTDCFLVLGRIATQGVRLHMCSMILSCFEFTKLMYCISHIHMRLMFQTISLVVCLQINMILQFEV